MSYSIVTDAAALTVETRGLRSEHLSDLRIGDSSQGLLQAAESMVRFVINYQRESSRVIRPGETMNYGYWTIKFIGEPDGGFAVHEYSPVEGEPDWVPGAERTLTYWQGQKELCESLSAEFAPPHGSEWAMVSDGFLDGLLPLEGQRWNTEVPDSGWIFTTDLYDGDLRSLKKVHLMTHPKWIRIRRMVQSRNRPLPDPVGGRCLGLETVHLRDRRQTRFGAGRRAVRTSVPGERVAPAFVDRGLL